MGIFRHEGAGSTVSGAAGPPYVRRAALTLRHFPQRRREKRGRMAWQEYTEAAERIPVLRGVV